MEIVEPLTNPYQNRRDMTPLSDIFRVSLRIGLLSFGGPAAQIALMHEEYVERRQWLGEDEFLRALSLTMLLPGPEAMQLATYAGWRQRGILGGLVSGGLFILPGALVIFLLAWAYLRFGAVPWVAALFTGIQACVVIIVISALLKMSKKALASPLSRLLAAGSFAALFLFNLPFPLVLASAALLAALRAMAQTPETPPPATGQTRPRNWSAIWACLLLWPLPIIAGTISGDALLQDLGIFFSKLAVVTFGGAYAVLTYMTQEVVRDYGWITTTQMIDALGLAETTPGPLILVTQFVGTLTAGLMGGLMVLWVTFIPCFLWIFLFAPSLDTLAGNPRLQAALSGVTAAVVGVILNLSVWFAMNVWFASTDTLTLAFATLTYPVIATFDPVPVLLSLVAAALLLWRKLPLPLCLTICGALAILLIR
jgi:chromate transporter